MDITSDRVSSQKDFSFYKDRDFVYDLLGHITKSCGQGSFIFKGTPFYAVKNIIENKKC